MPVTRAAGGHPPTPLTDVATADFDSALAINLRGTFLCLKHEIAAHQNDIDTVRDAMESRPIRP